MFTLKHIRLSGDEDLYTSATVRYSPGDDVRAVPPSPPTVWIEEKPGAPGIPLTGGTVFVMNDAGKTVARYDIGASMVPHEPIGSGGLGLTGDASAGGRYGSTGASYSARL